MAESMMREAVRVLVIDDEAPIRAILRDALEQAGYRVIEAGDATAALAAAREETPQVVLLDLGLPDRDGLDLIAPLRKAGATVLVVSARDATAQKVAALDRGADDYVTKPFDTDEVLARVRTALRHRASPDMLAAALRFDDVEIDLAARVVRKGAAEVHLAPKEFALLAELAANAGKVVTHAHLLRTIWGPGHETDVEYLRVAARGIRRKLEGETDTPSRIRNEPGVGYRLAVAIGG
jgi:two-component system KDP operon response regulator KdpE